MPESVEWRGLTAVYDDDELAYMVDLKAGVSAGVVDLRELEVVHEIKSLLGGHIVPWMRPQESATTETTVPAPTIPSMPEND